MQMRYRHRVEPTPGQTIHSAAHVSIGKDHYPHITRFITTLFDRGDLPNVRSIDIEPRYGYATRMTYVNGAVRITRSTDIGVNSSAAAAIAKDKDYTKHFLTKLGIECPPGETLLMPWWASKIRSPANVDRPLHEALRRLRESALYPVYVKPVDGCKGLDVWRCETETDVLAVFERYERERIRVAVVEREIRLPDYRIVVLDGSVICTYRRDPLSVIGDGTSTIADLVERRMALLLGGRRDVIPHDEARIARRLKGLGLTVASVIPRGEVVVLLDVSNLSAGGTGTDFSTQADRRWTDLACCIAGALGLRFCGVDIACPDITQDTDPYSVLEVNAAPGLDHFAAIGHDQDRLVEDIYRRVLNTLP
jgi:glutathione synthase/RimK-type ligase-like ATP-grasp enzyme